MPELPEVQTIAADLDEIVGQRVITEVRVNYPKIIAGEVEEFVGLVGGAEIKKVERLGKWIKFTLTNEAALLAHLKMTGQFHLGVWPEKDQWPPHAHVAFKLAGGPLSKEALHNTLFYKDIRKFGRLRAFTSLDLNHFLAELNQGPDPLTISDQEFFQRLTKGRGRLKPLLLDQTTVAGLGNIYVDESLFAARLSPLRISSTLTKIETDRLIGEIRRLLAASIKVRGSTTSNYQGLKGGGSFQNFHQVYGRAGEKCPVCAATIARATVGGRSTHYCPSCQNWSDQENPVPKGEKP